MARPGRRALPLRPLPALRPGRRYVLLCVPPSWKSSKSKAARLERAAVKSPVSTPYGGIIRVR